MNQNNTGTGGHSGSGIANNKLAGAHAAYGVPSHGGQRAGSGGGRQSIGNSFGITNNNSTATGSLLGP